MASTDTASGTLERHGLSDDQLRAIFRNMLLQRQLDNRGFQLNRQGKVPFALGSEGHEALQAGAAMAFSRGRDILAPYYRDLGLCLGIGLTPYEIMLSIFARATDHNGGRQFPNHYSAKAIGLMSFSSILAAHLPHAVGAAYAIKYRGETGRVVLATCGDGTTSEGEWHESMNFVSVH
ncbi:MAG: thiamine pyrophosphate-dependent dehydrogenase E1 component subunit alpha, partial [Candidatus Eremiobacteraeota bacterium]|nr:thiamine pyrophosphate-dependent dehydrogenase E1 component subunit alpha [Candidatus Eremiobacteraeota bacterium]